MCSGGATHQCALIHADAVSALASRWAAHPRARVHVYVHLAKVQSQIAVLVTKAVSIGLTKVRDGDADATEAAPAPWTHNALAEIDELAHTIVAGLCFRAVVITDRYSGAGLIIVVVDLIKLTGFTILKIIKQHSIISNPTNSTLLREGANFRGTTTFIRSIQPTIIPQYLGLCGTTKIIKFPVTNSILTILILSTLHICTSYQLTVPTHAMLQSITITINVTLWRVGIAAPTIAVLACGAGDSLAGRVSIALSILAVEPYRA